MKLIFLIAKKTILTLVACISTSFIACTENQLSPITFVKDGKPNYVILVNSDVLPLNEEANIISVSERDVPTVDAIGEQRNAVKTLINYVKQISGADLKVEPAKEGMTGFYVGLSSDFPWLKSDFNNLGNEGFQILKDGKNIYVVANNPIGIRHAVNTILMEAGCRWFFPGEEWEEIPSNKTIKITPTKQTLSFDMGRTIWYGFGTYSKQGKDKIKWDYHNRMGTIAPVNIGHTNYGIDFQKDFELHPEWFALVEGKRKASKVCYSHPDVIRRITDYALAQAERGVPISLSPADGLGFCECDLCFATAQGGEIIKDKGTFFATRPDSVFVCTVSETLFNAVNIAARAVGEKYPDAIIGCYGYSGYSQPPSFKLEPNVFVQTTTHYRRTPLSLEEQLELWGERCDHVGIRGYWSVYQWDWDNPLVGEFTPELIQRDLKFYKDNNTEAFSTEASNNWGPRGLSYYVGSHLLWNVDVNVQEIIKDFYEKAFGPAAESMQSYYAIWYGPGVEVLKTETSKVESDKSEDNLNIDEFGAYSPRLGLATIDDLRLAFKALDDASISVKDLPKYQARVDQLRMYMYYILLRYKVKDTSEVKSDEELIEAIKNETMFGARLTNTNMIHTRPLLGKAFMRLFREYEPLLINIKESQVSESGWREPIETPPTHDEIELLWEDGKKYLGLI